MMQQIECDLLHIFYIEIRFATKNIFMEYKKSITKEKNVYLYYKVNRLKICSHMKIY